MTRFAEALVALILVTVPAAAGPAGCRSGAATASDRGVIAPCETGDRGIARIKPPCDGAPVTNRTCGFRFSRGTAF